MALWRCDDCGADSPAETIQDSSPTKLRCPACSIPEARFYASTGAEGEGWRAETFRSLWTTEHSTAEARGLGLCLRPSVKLGIHVFADGSSTGACGAVRVWEQAAEQAERVVERCLPAPESPPLSRNVAAELDGVLLGLSLVPDGLSFRLVVDFLGTGLWANARQKAAHPEVLRRVDRIREEVARRNLVGAFFHTKGHRNSSADDFARWNARADWLCSTRTKAQRERLTEERKKLYDAPLPGGPCPVCGALTTRNPEHQEGCSLEGRLGVAHRDIKPENVPDEWGDRVRRLWETRRRPVERALARVAAESFYSAWSGARLRLDPVVATFGALDIEHAGQGPTDLDLRAEAKEVEDYGAAAGLLLRLPALAGKKRFVQAALDAVEVSSAVLERRTGASRAVVDAGVRRSFARHLKAELGR